MRLKTSLLVVSFCFLTLVPGWTQETSTAAPVQFRHKFKAGDIQRYKMVGKMKFSFSIPGMPIPVEDMEMGGSMTATLRAKTLGILPNGHAKVLYTYESVDLDFNMPGFPGIDKKTKTQMQKDILKQIPAMTMVMTKYGQVVDVIMPKDTPALQQIPGFDKLLTGQQGMGLWSIVFPAEAVSVGDAWTQDIPLLDAGKLTIDSTLESMNTQVGSRVAAKIKQDYLGSFLLGDLMKSIAPAMGDCAGQIPPVDGSVDASGWGVTYFDVDKGHLVRSDADIKMKITISAQLPAGMMGGEAAAPGQKLDVAMNMGLTFNMINVTK